MPCQFRSGEGETVKYIRAYLEEEEEEEEERRNTQLLSIRMNRPQREKNIPDREP